MNVSALVRKMGPLIGLIVYICFKQQLYRPVQLKKPAAPGFH